MSSPSHARRKLLKLGLASAVLAAPAAAFASTGLNVRPRRVVFDNLHTGEKLNAVYWEQGKYVPDALHAVNHVLRDFRNGEVHPIAPKLLDLLDLLSARVETNKPFQVISGYRSPKTNAKLHAKSGGVATKSLHMQGMAIDIRLADVDLEKLRNAALGMAVGGVGYYPASDFVHVDIGRVRRW